MHDGILKLKEWLEDNNALIGHLKGYVKKTGELTTFSTTGTSLNTEVHDSAGADIAFAAIVFGPDEETMKDKMVEIFKNI